MEIVCFPSNVRQCNNNNSVVYILYTNLFLNLFYLLLSVFFLVLKNVLGTIADERLQNITLEHLASTQSSTVLLKKSACTSVHNAGIKLVHRILM